MNMNVQNIYSYTPNFQSRNKEIRVADKIMRNAINTYPVISPSKVKYYNIYTKNCDNVKSKVQSVDTNLATVRARLKNLKDFEFIEGAIDEIKNNKVANCGEISKMMQAAFIANGYKDTKVVTLKKKQLIDFHPLSKPILLEQNVDHAVLLVNAGEQANFKNPKTINKHAFIVDPWLGFVDYASNGLSRYKDFFKIKNVFKDDNITKISNLRYDCSEPKLDVSDFECKRMAKKYPELVVNSSY